MNIQELKNKMESWSVSTKSKNFSFILTVFIWLVIFISLLVIKPIQKEPKYKEIQIVLDSVKKIEKKENLTTEKKDTLAKNQKENQQVEKSEPQETKEIVEQKVETPVPPVETKKVEQKPKVEPKKEVQNKIVEKVSEKKVAEKPKEVKKPAAKPVEKKVESKSTEKPAPVKEIVKTEPVKYAKSVEDLMEEQFQEKKSVEDFDWDSMFGDDSDSNTSSETKKITTKNTTAGTAGSVSENQNAVVSSTTKSNNTSQKVSESTSGKLSQISNAEFVGKSNISEKTSVETSVGSNGKVSVKMQNGQSRVLLSPSEPKIYISEEGAKLIEGSVTVVISFTVLESGTVPSGEISITPASLLPSTVRNEIVSQLSKWRFEADDFAALARLEFSIVKK